jgi:hypothetical protein
MVQAKKLLSSRTPRATALTSAGGVIVLLCTARLPWSFSSESAAAAAAAAAA